MPVNAEEAFKTRYTCFDAEGNERWSASADIVRAPDKGRDSYVLTEKGAGILSGFKGKVSWEARLEFESTGEMVKPVSMENRVFDSKNKLIVTEREEFDYDANKARHIREDALRKKEKRTEYSFKGDIVNKMILGLYIQKFLEHGREERSLTFLSNEPRLYEVKLKVVNKEEVVINGVSREAFRLCLDPKLGVLDFIKVIIPKAYVWHSAMPKFEWLKYRGLENSLGSPMVEIISGEIK
jgi:hypothetical protein